jgi:hypothetical protein
MPRWGLILMPKKKTPTETEKRESVELMDRRTAPISPSCSYPSDSSTRQVSVGWCGNFAAAQRYHATPLPWKFETGKAWRCALPLPPCLNAPPTRLLVYPNKKHAQSSPPGSERGNTPAEIPRPSSLGCWLGLVKTQKGTPGGTCNTIDHVSLCCSAPGGRFI